MDVRSLWPWKIGDPVGRGQSGSVYEVTETVAPFRHGALKILRGSHVRVSRDDFMRELKFVREQPIPGFMPRYFGSGELDDGTPWFVMEFAERLPAHLSRNEIIVMVDRIAEALERLDEKRYYHGDVKPGNIGLVDGRAVLLDFGSVCPHEDAATAAFRLGTPHYMAPELKLKDGGTVSVRTDVFSLGMTMEELRSEEDRRVFDPIIHHATALAPSDRPTPAAFRQELKDAIPSYLRDAAKASRVAKVKAVAKRVGLAGAAVAIGCAALLTLSYLIPRMQIEKRHDASLSAEANGKAGLVNYTRGEFQQAARLLESAAESPQCHDPEVFLALSDCYRCGRGVAQDLERSCRYARRAAELGDGRGRKIIEKLQRKTSVPQAILVSLPMPENQ